MSKKISSEDILREAILELCELENAAYDNMAKEEEEHIFSEKFEKEMEELIEAGAKGSIDKDKDADIIKYPVRNWLRKKSWMYKIALFAAIIFMTGSVTVMAVAPIREKVYKVVEKLFPDHTDIIFEETGEKQEEGDSESRTFDPADFPKKPSWVPEGYTLKSEDLDSENFFLMQVYVKSNQEIGYQQVTVESSGGWDITSNGEKAKEIWVGDKSALLFTDDDQYHTIVLENGGYAYLVCGYEDTEVLVKFLESVFEEETTESRTFNPTDFPKKLNWVPEGFTLDVNEAVPESFILMQVYTNGDKQIDYGQMTVEGSGGLSITSDGTPAEEVWIDNKKAYLFTDDQNYRNIMMESKGFIYTVGGNVDTEILVRCLESVFEKE